MPKGVDDYLHTGGPLSHSEGGALEARPAVPNPWLSMWISPRRTIREIVDTDPKHQVLLLAMLSGISEALDNASRRNLGDSAPWPLLIILSVFIGPIGGLVSFYLGSALLRFTCSRLGGRASGEEVRAAMAWSAVPLIWSLGLWVPELILFRNEMFTAATPRIDASPILTLLLLWFAVIELVVGIWYVVVFLKSIGEVNGFSAWKALAATILAGLVVIVPIVLFVGGLWLLTAPFRS